MPSVEAVVIRVLSKASRERPADAVLREELGPVRRVSPEVAREVARTVFAYYRWRGWVRLDRGWPEQLREVAVVAAQFARDPASVGDLRAAVPAWVLDHVEVEPGWLRALQEEPRLWLRARPGTAPILAVELGAAHPGPGCLPDALEYMGTEDLFRTEAFHQGRFELQDLTSQAVSVAASPKPGETWWDACAGEGGKTLHLADLMANRGCVWATDRVEWRLKRLRMRAGRAGLFNIRWGAWDGRGRPPGPGPGGFDGVLVDAPCSGVGTWQRNPQARWTTSESDVHELAGIQSALLKSASAGVKRGGRLVYAVCTLTREETTGVAAGFEASATGFTREPVPLSVGSASQGWLLPEEWGGNGMYVAIWRRD